MPNLSTVRSMKVQTFGNRDQLSGITILPGKHPNSSEGRIFWLWPLAWSLDRKVGEGGHPLRHERIVQREKEAQGLYFIYFMLAVAHSVDFILSFLTMAMLPTSRQKSQKSFNLLLAQKIPPNSKSH